MKEKGEYTNESLRSGKAEEIIERNVESGNGEGVEPRRSGRDSIGEGSGNEQAGKTETTAAEPDPRPITERAGEIKIL